MAVYVSVIEFHLSVMSESYDRCPYSGVVSARGDQLLDAAGQAAIDAASKAENASVMPSGWWREFYGELASEIGELAAEMEDLCG